MTRPGSGRATKEGGSTIATDVARELALICARAAEERKAREITVLDLSSTNYITDYFVVCTAENQRHAQAIRQAVKQTVGADGRHPIGVEGDGTTGWVLIDFGDCVIHVFEESLREFYDLDLLWGDCPRLAWQND